MNPSAGPSSVVWRKASKSTATGNECVEVAYLSGEIGVRDSRAPEAPHLVLGAADWRVFARRVKDGAHDLP